MSTVERIEQQIKNHPILLYMKGTPETPMCGFSAQAVKLLNACGEKFAFVNILEEENQDIRQTIKEYANWPTFPQLYINGELVGGTDIMLELYEQGELAKMLKAVVEE